MTKGKFLGALALNAIMLGTVTSASCDDKPAKNEGNEKKAATEDEFLKSLKLQKEDPKDASKKIDYTEAEKKAAVKAIIKDLVEADETTKKDLSKCVKIGDMTCAKADVESKIKIQLGIA